MREGARDPGEEERSDFNLRKKKAKNPEAGKETKVKRDSRSTLRPFQTRRPEPRLPSDSQAQRQGAATQRIPGSVGS